MDNSIAIDFGTSRTKLAYNDPISRKPELMRFSADNPFLPSIFYLDRDSDGVLLGYDADEMLRDDPAGMVVVLKRHIRQSFVRANRRKVTPTDLITFLFTTLRTRAGHEIPAFEGQVPDRVYLTVPALFGPPDEKVLTTAAQNAGFKQIEFVQEPVAAARAWLSETGQMKREIVVLDCGGGTIDWAYLRGDGHDFKMVPECPPSGDRNIGGHDIDQELLNLFKDQLEEEDYDEIEPRNLHYLKQIRALKERYCRGVSLRPIRVGRKKIPLDEKAVLSIIEQRFVNQACENLKAYIESVKNVSSGQGPMVLMVGGSSRLKGLAEAIESQCGCKTFRWERSEYAAVLGAINASSAEAATSDQSPGQLKTPEVKDPETLYRGAVSQCWRNQELSQTDVDRLKALAAELALDRRVVNRIENEIMGANTEEIIHAQQSGNQARSEKVAPDEAIRHPTVYCRMCGYQVSPHATTCRNCAFDLTQGAKSTMYCSKCGQKIPTNTRFCQYCRDEIQTRTQPSPDKPAKISGFKGFMIILISIILFPLGFLIGLLYLNSKDPYRKKLGKRWIKVTTYLFLLVCLILFLTFLTSVRM